MDGARKFICRSASELCPDYYYMDLRLYPKFLQQDMNQAIPLKKKKKQKTIKESVLPKTVVSKSKTDAKNMMKIMKNKREQM